MDADPAASGEGRRMSWRAAYLRARKARKELRAGGQREEGAAPAAPASLDLVPDAAEAAPGTFSLTKEQHADRYAAFFAEHGPYPAFTDAQIARYERRWAVAHPRRRPVIAAREAGEPRNAGGLDFAVIPAECKVEDLER